jgi:hypothetical protein
MSNLVMPYSDAANRTALAAAGAVPPLVALLRSGGRGQGGFAADEAKVVAACALMNLMRGNDTIQVQVKPYTIRVKP